MTRLARASWMVLALLIIVTAPASAESPDEVFSFANHLKRDGLNEAAAQQFLRFARENPTDGRAPEALLSAADCLNASGGTEQAVTVLEAIVSTYPDHPEQCRVQVQLGRLYAKLDRYDEADRTFTRVAVTMPDCALVPDALLGKGEALMAQKNFAAASEVLRTVVESHVESKAAPRAAY
ncbi:MAG: tetratricopeptide repeat protein, partial [Candidatus Krumholzibacteria bacterium]|nr:tetratricopeptide repeat protein [Candidatus Krumholzibacteria bacterium]